jgi:hypothetical protein
LHLAYSYLQVEPIEYSVFYTMGGVMPIINTFTTVEPISVCYPRLNGTLPLEDVKVHDLGTSIDDQGLYLVNKAEGLGLSRAVGLLLVK